MGLNCIWNGTGGLNCVWNGVRVWTVIWSRVRELNYVRNLGRGLNYVSIGGKGLNTVLNGFWIYPTPSRSERLNQFYKSIPRGHWGRHGLKLFTKNNINMIWNAHDIPVETCDYVTEYYFVTQPYTRQSPYILCLLATVTYVIQTIFYPNTASQYMCHN